MPKKVTTAKLTNSAIFYRVGVPSSQHNFGFLVASNYSFEKRANPLRDTSLPSFINLGVLLPSIADQRLIGDCQSFTMDYNIGSYYVMLQYYNLTLSSNLLYSILNNSIWTQGEEIVNYYISNNSGSTNPNSIINPLYTWTVINGCNSTQIVSRNILNYFPTSQNGVYTYYDYDLPFDPPQVNNGLIVGCPATLQPNALKLYPFLPSSYTPPSSGYLNGTIPLFKRTQYTSYVSQNGGTAAKAASTLLNTIKTYLSQGIPLFLGININTFFSEHFLSGINPNVTSYYNSSNIVPLIPTTSTPNSPVIFNGIDGILYGTTNTTSDYINVGGAHAVTLCGYIDNVKVNNNGTIVPLSTICPDGSSGVFIFANSWSTKFGNIGYGYISYNYFLNCFNSAGFDIVTNPITNTLMNGSYIDGVYYLPFNTTATETYKNMLRMNHNSTN